MAEMMRCVLLYMLEAAESELCLPEVLEAMRCMLEAVDGSSVCRRRWRCWRSRR